MSAVRLNAAALLTIAWLPGRLRRHHGHVSHVRFRTTPRHSVLVRRQTFISDTSVLPLSTNTHKVSPLAPVLTRIQRTSRAREDRNTITHVQQGPQQSTKPSSCVACHINSSRKADAHLRPDSPGSKAMHEEQGEVGKTGETAALDFARPRFGCSPTRRRRWRGGGESGRRK